MSAFTQSATISPVRTVRPAGPVITDAVGYALNLRDVVVEAIMSRKGITCPKRAARPETFEVVGLCPDKSDSFLVWSELTGKTETFHKSEIVWFGRVS